MPYAEPEAEEDDQVPQNRAQRRNGEVVVAVEDPHHDPGQPEDENQREEDASEARRDHPVLVVRPVAEDRHHQRRDHDEECREATDHDQHQPEERGGDSPGAFPLPLDEQLAEDRDERGRERGAGEERLHGVRDQECNLERIDRAGDTEGGCLRDLPRQADHA